YRIRIWTSTWARAGLGVVLDVDLEVVVTTKAVRKAGRSVDCSDVVLAGERGLASNRCHCRAGLCQTTHRVALDDPVVLASWHRDSVDDLSGRQDLSVDVEAVALDIAVLQVLDREPEVAPRSKVWFGKPAAACRESSSAKNNGHDLVFDRRDVVTIHC